MDTTLRLGEPVWIQSNTVDGTEVEARRIRISLPGLGVLIWRSDNWFRLSDGLFVQSNVTRGPPGTPPTIVSLLSP